MKAEDLYHTGIVVEDVDVTMRWLTETAGYRWCDTFVGEQEVELADGIRTVPLHFAYSVTEPRLEVLAAQPGTVWEVTESGLHHLGFWSDDVEKDVAELEAHGHTGGRQGPRPLRHVALGLLHRPRRAAHRAGHPVARAPPLRAVHHRSGGGPVGPDHRPHR